MSFKKLTEACRINALMEFLEAASLLSGLLVCVAVEKPHMLQTGLNIPTLQHDWTPDTLEKLVRICVFGGGFVNGLRGNGQNLFWITDDDAVVATEKAKEDTAMLMKATLYSYPGEAFNMTLGIGSQFDDDVRAEDLLAIPDLAAGAFSEGLTQLGKRNIPTVVVGPSGANLVLQIKSLLINAWQLDKTRPLKHLHLVIRQSESGLTGFSFCEPIIRAPALDKSLSPMPELDPKWRRALEAELARRNRIQMPD